MFETYAGKTLVAISIHFNGLGLPTSWGTPYKVVGNHTAVKEEFAGTCLQTREDELAKQELARIMPTRAKLLALAAKNPPLPSWFDQEEDAPF